MPAASSVSEAGGGGARPHDRQSRRSCGTSAPPVVVVDRTSSSAPVLPAAMASSIAPAASPGVALLLLVVLLVSGPTSSTPRSGRCVIVGEKDSSKLAITPSSRAAISGSIVPRRLERDYQVVDSSQRLRRSKIDTTRELLRINSISSRLVVVGRCGLTMTARWTADWLTD